MEIFWFIPTNGDFRQLNHHVGARPASYDYTKQIAQAVDQLGYTGVLIPTGKTCEEGFIIGIDTSTGDREFEIFSSSSTGSHVAKLCGAYVSNT